MYVPVVKKATPSLRYTPMLSAECKPLARVARYLAQQPDFVSIAICRRVDPYHEAYKGTHGRRF